VYKFKNLGLVVCLIIMVSLFFFPSCGKVGGPNGPDDTTPHDKSVLVKYVRVQPIPYPEGMWDPDVQWTYGSFQGGSALMSPTSEENTFTASAAIQTETVITMYVDDIKEWNGSSYWVCKYIYIDGHELVVSSTYGKVKFKVHNDGTVVVVP
jgi:hypothetical protein